MLDGDFQGLIVGVLDVFVSSMSSRCLLDVFDLKIGNNLKWVSKLVTQISYCQIRSEFLHFNHHLIKD